MLTALIAPCWTGGVGAGGLFLHTGVGFQDEWTQYVRKGLLRISFSCVVGVEARLTSARFQPVFSGAFSYVNARRFSATHAFSSLHAATFQQPFFLLHHHLFPGVPILLFFPWLTNDASLLLSEVPSCLCFGQCCQPFRHSVLLYYCNNQTRVWHWSPVLHGSKIG